MANDVEHLIMANDVEQLNDVEERVKRSQGSTCGDIWVDGDSVFGAFAAAGAAFAYILYTTITMMMRKKKKREASQSQSLLDMIQSGILVGNALSDSSIGFQFTCIFQCWTLSMEC